MNIRYISKLVFLTLLGFSFTNLSAEGDLVRDIILINGIAELVDVTKDGDVVQRYVVIEDYFSSGRSHKRSLRQSMEKLKIFGLHRLQGEHEQIVYSAPVECRQSSMVHPTQSPTVKVISVDRFLDLEEAGKLRLSHPTNDLTHLTLNPIDVNFWARSQPQAIAVSNQVKQHFISDRRFEDIERVLVTSCKTSEASNDV